jgi:Subtilisin inhibitor-like
MVPLAVAAMLGPVAPAGAASAAGHRTALVLTVRGDGYEFRTAVLRCDPPGGSHPRAGEACADLSGAGGNLDALPGDPQVQFCTMEYRPVTASARGVWRGRPVRWSHEYGNPCALRAATGPVFSF